MQNPIAIGKQVYLRPLESTDAITIQPWVNDPEVTKYLLVHTPMDLKSEEQFISRINASEHDQVMVIMRMDIDRPIGVTGLHQINFKNRNAHFGITIGDKDSWGNGFGTEATELLMNYAFATLNLHRVTLHVYEYNERAHHIYAKLGFREEGRLRQDHYLSGRYWDVIVMGLLRDEWITPKANNS